MKPSLIAHKSFLNEIFYSIDQWFSTGLPQHSWVPWKSSRAGVPPIHEHYFYYTLVKSGKGCRQIAKEGCRELKQIEKPWSRWNVNPKIRLGFNPIALWIVRQQRKNKSEVKFSLDSNSDSKSFEFKNFRLTTIRD